MVGMLYFYTASRARQAGESAQFDEIGAGHVVACLVEERTYRVSDHLNGGKGMRQGACLGAEPRAAVDGRDDRRHAVVQLGAQGVRVDGGERAAFR